MLYTAIKKKPKVSEPNDEEEIPPIPPHTDEEQYTAVEKKLRSIADKNEDVVPAHKVEKMYTAKRKPSPVLQNTVEDLYTAVMRKLQQNLMI